MNGPGSGSATPAGRWSTWVREHRQARAVPRAEEARPACRLGTGEGPARGRVIELRRQGLSTYEISARLAAEGRPLNRTSVAEILAGEKVGRPPCSVGAERACYSA